jgi:hypothetical protein
MARKRNAKGRFVKGGTTRKNPRKRRRPRRASAAPRVNPRRRRARRAAAPRANPRRRRARRRSYRANPAIVSMNPKRRRSRRRGGYKRNPGGSVGAWLLAGAAAMATTLGAGLVLPLVVPQSIQASPLLYGAGLGLLGLGAGLALSKWGMPIAAVGVGIPLLSFGGFIAYSGIRAKMAEAPKANPHRLAARPFADAYSMAQRTGPNMGAVASYTPRMGMGAVLESSGYSTMAAVEAMVGDRSVRPSYYSRAGAELGAR